MSKDHLFVIDSAVWQATKLEDVIQTCRDLRELDLFKLPYPNCAVQVPTDDAVHWARANNADVVYPAGSPMDALDALLTSKKMSFSGLTLAVRDYDGKVIDGSTKKLGPGHSLLATDLNTEGRPCRLYSIHDGSNPGWRPYKIDITDHVECWMANGVLTSLLITLLATRNIGKQTRVNKLARLGIGTKSNNPTRRFAYTTTISLPAHLDDDTGPAAPVPGKSKAPHLRRGHIRRQKYGPKLQHTRQIWIEPIFVNADPDFINTRRAYNVVDHKTPIQGPTHV